jgi:hypothetical protein
MYSSSATDATIHTTFRTYVYQVDDRASGGELFWVPRAP